MSHVPAGTPIEIWFQDEARIGQKNGRTRIWARKGSRPRLPADQRYKSAYLFGAVCAARDTGAALVLPWANTETMNMHLKEIGRIVRPGAHAVVLMDRAPWHTSGELKIPKNLTPIFLPARSPELNPVENIWRYLRQNWLSNRIFEDHEDLLSAGCTAWNNLITEPTAITTIASRQWANIGQS